MTKVVAVGRPCLGCGLPIRSTNKSGYCRRTRGCSNASRRIHKRREPYSERCFEAAYYRAKRSGIPFTLTLADLPPIPERCPALGIILRPNGSNADRASSPTLDRIIPEEGYVPGNVQWLSHRANRLKSDATPLELVLLGRFMLTARAQSGGAR